MKRTICLTIAVFMLTANISIAAGNFDYSRYNTLKGSAVVVPAGQVFQAITTMPVSSETLTLGQTVTLALPNSFAFGGSTIAPEGSTITGTVLEVVKAKHGSMNGRLLIRFNKIVTPDGTQIPISAVIRTTDDSGLLVGGTSIEIAKDYTKDIVAGAGAGALAGLIISPLAGGSIGKGTALATAVGATGGLVKSLWDKGSDVSIPVNSFVELVLTQPITVNPVNRI
ncbi:MAG: hypothetical protein LBK53_00800 [Heliobacteriaceae bacterium]|jgi:hypothetical protein|nr:hypothetical protein [Heliobacteriaceae bacterium]